MILNFKFNFFSRSVELLHTDRYFEGIRSSPTLAKFSSCMPIKTDICLFWHIHPEQVFCETGIVYAYPEGLTTRWDRGRICGTSLNSCEYPVPSGLNTWGSCSQRTCIFLGTLFSGGSDSGCECTWCKSQSPSQSWRSSGGLSWNIKRARSVVDLRLACSVTLM
jgi:hypothetical protein